MSSHRMVPVLAAVLLLAGCRGDGTADAAPETVADTLVLGAQDVATAERGALTTGVTLSGSLDPYRVVEVRAQVPGIVQAIRADRGESVRQGSVMAVIEAEGIRGQATGARAAVAAAEANLALASQQLESARTLYDAGALSEIDFRGAQAAYEAARAQLAAARGQAAGASEQARRATVSAPITGQVSRRQVSQGEAVNPGQALFTIVNTQFLELAGQVPVTDAAGVKVGQPVEFSLVSQRGRTFRGEVARVDPTADPSTRQVGVYLRLSNTDLGLVGGQFATGRVVTGSQTEVVVVPAGAVREESGRQFVWAIDGGSVGRKAVTITGRDDSRGVVAVSGIDAGQRVVVALGDLEEGTPVVLGSAPASAVRDTGGS